MRASSKEVEAGSALAAESADALQGMNGASQARNAALEDVFASIGAIRDATRELVTSVAAIEEIAEGTQLAAEEVKAAAASASMAMDSIAAVAQENSAATEEVGAATQEMSAQAEQVVESGATVAEMARALDELTGTFLMAGTDEPADANDRTEISKRAPGRSGRDASRAA